MTAMPDPPPVRAVALIAIGSLVAACGSDPAPPPAASAPSATLETTERTEDPVGPSDVEAAETLDQELERLVRTHDAQPMWVFEDRDDPVRVQKYRRDLVLKARERAAADIAAGKPRIVTYGLTLGDAPDIDPDTGFAYRYLG